jgi:small subunit ribosomal protein S14
MDTLCQSLLNHRDSVRNQLVKISEESAGSLRNVADSFDFSEYEEISVDHNESDDGSKSSSVSTVKATSGGGGTGSGGVMAAGGGSSSQSTRRGPKADSRHQCRKCGGECGLVGKYDIFLCRQCFRELASSIGFKKYR